MKILSQISTGWIRTANYITGQILGEVVTGRVMITATTIGTITQLNRELREDGGLELREDGGVELRED